MKIIIAAHSISLGIVCTWCVEVPHQDRLVASRRFFGHQALRGRQGRPGRRGGWRGLSRRRVTSLTSEEEESVIIYWINTLKICYLPPVPGLGTFGALILWTIPGDKTLGLITGNSPVVGVTKR